MRTTMRTIRRLDKDLEFAERYRNLIKLFSFFGKIGFLYLIKLLPVSLNTPMEFEWKKNDK